MAAAVSADPHDRFDAVAFECRPTSNVVVLPVVHDVTLLRDEDDVDDDDARMALIPNDSVTDDVT